MTFTRLLLRRRGSAPFALLQQQQGRQLSTAASLTQQTLESSSSQEAEGVKKMNLCSAVNDALHIAMATDKKALVFGEDVSFGGVFRCTVGLLERFGRDRVFNTPLSEQGIVGFAAGAAASGYTPVAEIQFADYIFPAFDQITNEIAKYRYRTGGKFDVGGLTIRTPYGAVGHGGHYHSQSPEAFFTHVPGVKVVMPCGPAQAKGGHAQAGAGGWDREPACLWRILARVPGLLLASIRDPNPVIFFEAKMLYRTAVEDVPLSDYEVPLGKARRVREGGDVTLVTWGQQVLVAELAAREVEASDGISCDVLDLQTLLPWDVEAAEASLNRTGRLVVTHEAPLTSGFGAEVVSSLVQRCFWRLEAPPLRVAGWDTPFPLIYEPLYLPSVKRVADALRKVVRS
ncbi:hypothetical protein N2152v2_005112 [Parachlorella kessleri]